MSPAMRDSDQASDDGDAEQPEKEDEVDAPADEAYGHKKPHSLSNGALPPRTAEQDQVEKEWGFYRSPAESSTSTPAPSQGRAGRDGNEDDRDDSETEDEREEEQYRVSAPSLQEGSCY